MDKITNGFCTKYECDRCGRVFSYVGQMLSHLKDCTGSEFKAAIIEGAVILNFRGDRYELVPGEKGFVISCNSQISIIPVAGNSIEISKNLIEWSTK